MANIYMDFEVLKGGICLYQNSNFQESTKSLWLKEYTSVVSKIPGVRELTKYSIRCDFLTTNRDRVSYGFIFAYRKAAENGGQYDSFYMLYFYPYQNRIYFKKQLNDGSIITIRDDYHNRYTYGTNIVYPTELVWDGENHSIEWSINNTPVFSIQDESFNKGGWGLMTDWCDYRYYFVVDNLNIMDIE